MPSLGVQLPETFNLYRESDAAGLVVLETDNFGHFEVLPYDLFG